MANQERNGYQFPEYLTDIFDLTSKLNAKIEKVRKLEYKRLLDSGIAIHESDAESLMICYDKANENIGSVIGYLGDYAGGIIRATMFEDNKEEV